MPTHFSNTFSYQRVISTPLVGIMELESIAIICLVTLVVLIFQIVVTLHLSLHFYSRIRANERTKDRCGPGAIFEAQPSLEEGRALSARCLDSPSVAGRPYAPSSVYSSSTAASGQSPLDGAAMSFPSPVASYFSQESVPRAGPAGNATGPESMTAHGEVDGRDAMSSSHGKPRGEA